MINFFRQIRRKQADDNQFLKYSRYAFGEIVLVVIGILIALSINNWWQNIQKSQNEFELLTQLEAEFKLNKSNLNGFIELLQQREKTTKELYQLFGLPKEKVDENKLDSLLAVSIYYSKFNFSHGVLNESINSGKISLIQNDELRVLYSSWFGAIANAQQEDNLLYEYMEHSVFVYSLDYLNYNRIERFTTMSKLIKNESVYKKSNIDILNNLSFENRILELIWYLEHTRIIYRDIIPIMDEIIELTELERRKFNRD